HAVVCDSFDLDRQKGADSDVKCQLRMGNSREEVRSEMQARSRGRHGTGDFGENSLVSDLILRVGVAMEIGRDGYAAETLQVRFRVEFHDPRSVFENLSDMCRGVGD